MELTPWQINDPTAYDEIEVSRIEFMFVHILSTCSSNQFQAQE
jgi:hypothetical protein